jgi:hypothetical protein
MKLIVHPEIECCAVFCRGLFAIVCACKDLQFAHVGHTQETLGMRLTYIRKLDMQLR